jgi:hypothetical protein
LPPGPSGSVVDGNPVGRVTEVTVVVGSGPLEFGATTVVDVTLDGANPPPCPALAVSAVADWLRRGPASVDVVDGPGTDQGTVVQDGMAYWRKTGLGGHRIAVFAEVAVDDLDEVKTATHLFGSVGVGFAFPPPRWASSTAAGRGTWSRRRRHRRQPLRRPDRVRPEVYRRDRTEGQEASLYLGVEKATYIDYLLPWFGDLGIPILPCGGYTSQTFTQTIVRDVSHYRRADGRQRPAILIVASDFDPSGLDIERDLVARTDCWDKVIRVALNYEQLAEFNLPENPGKESDSRKGEMIRRYGRNIQVELEALDEEVLRQLYQDAIDQFWDTSRYEAVLEREAADIEALPRWSP